MCNHPLRNQVSGKSCWCYFCCYCLCGGFLLLFLALFQMFDSVTNFDAQSDGERLIERAHDQNNQREGRRLKLVTAAKEVDFFVVFQHLESREMGLLLSLLLGASVLIGMKYELKQTMKFTI